MRNVLLYAAAFIIIVWALFFTLNILFFVVKYLLIIAAILFLIWFAMGRRRI